MMGMCLYRLVHSYWQSSLDQIIPRICYLRLAPLRLIQLQVYVILKCQKFSNWASIVKFSPVCSTYPAKIIDFLHKHHFSSLLILSLRISTKSSFFPLDNHFIKRGQHSHYLTSQLFNPFFTCTQSKRMQLIFWSNHFYIYWSVAYGVLILVYPTLSKQIFLIFLLLQINSFRTEESVSKSQQTFVNILQIS